MTGHDAALSLNRFETRLATRLVFFIGGLTMGAWSPLIPFAQQRLGVDDAGLGLLLLCLGIGSVLFMPLAGPLCAAFGSRRVIVGSGIGLIAGFPALGYAETIPLMAIAVFLFGSFLGVMEVGMNSHAVDVESGSDKPLMSGFHAQFSIGGFAGAGGVTLFLTLGLSPFASAGLIALSSLLLLILAAPRLLPNRTGGSSTGGAFPKGVVLLLALLIAITFLTEGAVLDWSAALITDQGLVDIAQGGIGFMCFSITMTIGRLLGDRVVARFGPKNILLWGGVITIAGILLVATAGNLAVSLIGFAAIGAGVCNIVPVLFSLTGRQKVMPQGAAIAAVATAGYGGILLGPAVIGFVADGIGLPVTFAGLSLLMVIVALSAGVAVQGSQAE
ncbi:MFS transporter [Labrenzia sp. R4_1]|uniref:MFS transporter n=1 Tax=Labrenzia sp. R4_1 TaxID=2821106 RepID=UPI00336A277C